MSISEIELTKYLAIYQGIFDDKTFNKIAESIHTKCTNENSIENARDYMENTLRVLLKEPSKTSSAINKTKNNQAVVSLLKEYFRKRVGEINPNANFHYLEAQATNLTNRFINGEKFCELAEKLEEILKEEQTETNNKPEIKVISKPIKTKVTSKPVFSRSATSKKLLIPPQNLELSEQKLENNTKFYDRFGENKTLELGIIRRSLGKFVDCRNINGTELLLSMLIDKLIESPPEQFDSDFFSRTLPQIIAEIKSSEKCPDCIKNFSPPNSNRR